MIARESAGFELQGAMVSKARGRQGLLNDEHCTYAQQ